MINKIRDDLDYIIHNQLIKTVFQPIISLRDGRVLGYEALSRITCNCDIKTPDHLFSAAQEYNRLWELELLCRATALESAMQFMRSESNKKLFLNVNQNTMHDETFKKGFTKAYLKQYDITPNHIIFEITERNAVSDMEGFRTTIEHYKTQGYGIAIDDVGAGFSGLNLISDLNPNYIKLDMKLIRSIDKDSLKYALVKGMVELSKTSNISLIAEGIETPEEAETLIFLGVQYGQGYYIQYPQKQVIPIQDKIIRSVNEINTRKSYLQLHGLSNCYVKNLCMHGETIAPSAIASDVYEYFMRHKDCIGLCVVEDSVPIGIVTREKLILLMSGNYGFALHQHKPIYNLMDTQFLSVDHLTPVSHVSSMAMARSNDKLYDFIVVTENERYLGNVTIKVLLQKSTEIEVSAAKHQNPLTGLPGNLMIEEHLKQCLSNDSDYTVAYLDIHNFKSYNDVYGIEKGDMVITRLADILKVNLSNVHFIGHVGGDDFIVVVHRHVKEDYFDPIVELFEKQLTAFYDKSDYEKSYIVSQNRHGQTEVFPLISLTCVTVSNETENFKNAYDLTEKLAELKKQARQKNTVTPDR